MIEARESNKNLIKNIVIPFEPNMLENINEEKNIEKNTEKNVDNEILLTGLLLKQISSFQLTI
jgi:hypothetical protein